MTEAQVLRQVGQPSQVHRARGRWGEAKQLAYDTGHGGQTFLHMENGKLVQISDW